MCRVIDARCSTEGLAQQVLSPEEGPLEAFLEFGWSEHMKSHYSMEASTVFFLNLIFTQRLMLRVLDLSSALHQLTVSSWTTVLTLPGLPSP